MEADVAVTTESGVGLTTFSELDFTVLEAVMRLDTLLETEEALECK